MTGRELIMYILENNLENEPIINNGNLVGFLTVNQLASRLNVGSATVRTWIALGFIEYARIGEVIIIPDIYDYEVKELSVRKRHRQRDEGSTK